MAATIRGLSFSRGYACCQNHRSHVVGALSLLRVHTRSNNHRHYHRNNNNNSHNNNNRNNNNNSHNNNNSNNSHSHNSNNSMNNNIVRRFASHNNNNSMNNNIVRRFANNNSNNNNSHNNNNSMNNNCVRRFASNGSFARAVKTSGPGGFYDRTVETWSQKSVLPVALNDLYTPNTTVVSDEDLIGNAARVHQQVAIRLAKRIRKMQMLPVIVGVNPHIHSLYTIYCDSFERLTQLPEPKTLAQERHMTKKIFPKLLESTQVVIPTLAAASVDIAQLPKELVPRKAMFEFLDSMLIGRIYRRTLVANHMRLGLLHENRANEVSTLMSGTSEVVEDDCDVVDIATSAWEFTKQDCEKRYGQCPELIISEPGKNICYIKTHIKYMLIELFKNSARATIEFHQKEFGSEAHLFPIPPIEMTVLPSSNDCTITVRDKGGGFPPLEKSKCFEYNYSTWRTNDEETEAWPGISEEKQRIGGTSGISGQGFGLPMIRQYANFFGGELQLMPVVGHGTDAYLRLPDLNPTLPQPRLSPEIDDIRQHFINPDRPRKTSLQK